jgi:predicted homoserine dehydrogenase-like protein
VKPARPALSIHSPGAKPALIAEHVDWARTCGFQIVAAGKGTRYLPSYHGSTPETVWDIISSYLKVERDKVNLQMFNSFIDGTKSAIEMTAVCNASNLMPQAGGLTFPPSTRFELADILNPKSEGGLLETQGVTEVVSSLYRDGTDVPHDVAMEPTSSSRLRAPMPAAVSASTTPCPTRAAPTFRVTAQPTRSAWN